MNITVYLPDEIARQARAAGLKPSRLLRDAVTNELHRKAAMETEPEEARTYELQLKDSLTGAAYTGRITGTVLAQAGEVAAYLTTDGRVIAYDAGGLRYGVVENPEDELAAWFGTDRNALFEALVALGFEPVVDL